jgi:hypothetical protein
MDELVKIISEKVGVSDITARKAVLITSDYLKDNLPGAVYEQVHAALEMDKVTEEEYRELGLFAMP